ncbi:hypothetical protein [Halobacteriovorax sp. HLS]|uniref:hypothetical protein n=1 Tax=Halobacteriovorax sp. HLS TaxID=2234000 RepID=UPI000FDA57F7|nr:hypothetical protein [Halobacteriovorax sp. HLS]
MKRFISAFIIYIISFQMAFAETISRIPASQDYGHEISIEAMSSQIESFRDSIKGKDLKADCNTDAADALEKAAKQEETQSIEADDEDMFADDSYESVKYDENTKTNWEKILAGITEASCGQYLYTFDEDLSKEEAQKCVPKRQKGHIEKFAENMIKLEDEEKELPALGADDKLLRSLHKKAEFLKRELRKYLYDDEVEEEVRRKMLVEYLGGVLLPMRDLVISKRSYVDREYDGEFFYESLLPEFPTDLFPEDEIDQRKLITMGPDETTDPFHLKVSDESWGKSTLKFNENEILSRDVLTLVKTPTKRNYARALKWLTLHMMLSQVYVYDAIRDNKNPVEIPRSCQSHFNGNLPEKFEFNFAQGQGDTYLENIMSGHGLTFSYSNYQFLEYYMDNADKNPLKTGYSGLMPFQEYKSALRNDRDGSHFTNPDIDDISHYETVMQMKLPYALQIFKGKVRGSYNRRTKKHTPAKRYTYNLAEEFQKFFQRPDENKIYETKLEDGSTVGINTQRQNLSLFLTELMQKYGKSHYTEIMSDRLVSKLKSNKVRIKIPSLYGSAVWRHWALKNLAMYFETHRNISKNSDIYKRAATSCYYSKSGSKLCKTGRDGHIIANIADYLKDFTNSNDFIPTRRLEEMKIEENYALFGYFWNISANSLKSDFSFAHTNEYKFLTDQMTALNPWASVRMSYLVALDELEQVQAGMTPVYKTGSRGRRQTNESRASSARMKNHIEMLNKAAKEAGINKVLTPSYANGILSEDEKNAFWSDIKERVNEENSNLFQTKFNGKSYYSRLEDLSYQTLLTREGVSNYSSQNGVSLSSQAWDEIEDTLDSDEGKLGSFFLDLYKNKGNINKQIEMFDDFSKENGIDNAYSAKMNFLSLDNSIKAPIFKDLIKESALVRKREVMNNLSEFCNMEPNDHESFKTLFYATSKAQNELNMKAGLPGVPENVLDKINSMSDAEWTDMWLGLGAGFLGVAAILIGAACTGVTGGLCAPLGIAMMAAGTSALGMQVALVSREVDRKLDADVNEAKVDKMEKLGFATSGSSDEVARSWGWAIFETVSIIPLIGVVSRSAKVGAKLTYVSARTMMRNTGKVGFKSAWKMAGVAGQKVVTEADVNFARYVLGFKSLKDDVARLVGRSSDDAAKLTSELSQELMRSGLSEDVVKNAMGKVDDIKGLYKSGKISVTEMVKRIGKVITPLKKLAKEGGDDVFKYTSNVIVKETPELIDRKTAEVVAEYFGHNPNGLKNLLQSYSTKWFSSHDKLVHARAVMMKANKGEYLWGTNWARKLRFEELAKNGSKMKRMTEELAEVAARGDDLTEYLVKNMENLTDIFVKIPVRKRELPYMFFLQGGPHVGGVMKNTTSGFVNRVSGAVYDLADGLIMRKFLNARARLVYESTKATARESFGLSKYVAAETTFEALKAFDKTVDDAILSSSKAKSKKLAADMEVFKDAVANRVHAFAKNKVDQQGLMKFISQLKKGEQAAFKEFVELTPDAVKKLLFNSKGPKQEALAQVIWSAVPVDDVFETKQLGDMAYKVVRELSEYNTASEFDKFVSALKILIISRDPGVVEIM